MKLDKSRGEKLLEKWRKVIKHTNSSPTAILIESQEHWMRKPPPPENDPRWPKIGDKVKFLTAEGMFYPHYTNVIANAKEKLRIGEIYTVNKCEVYSSWCAVWLEGFEEDELFHLSMFEFPVDKDKNVV